MNALTPAIAQGRAELDQVKRGVIYQQADRLMLEDMPIVPCFAGDALNLGLPTLKHFTQLPYSNFADQFYDRNGNPYVVTGLKPRTDGDRTQYWVTFDQMVAAYGKCGLRLASRRSCAALGP